MADNIRVLVLKFLLDVMKKFLRYFAEAAPDILLKPLHICNSFGYISTKGKHHIIFYFLDLLPPYSEAMITTISIHS